MSIQTILRDDPVQVLNTFCLLLRKIAYQIRKPCSLSMCFSFSIALRISNPNISIYRKILEGLGNSWQYVEYILSPSNVSNRPLTAGDSNQPQAQTYTCL